MNTATLRQILLITDGCSNQGENPENVARQAYLNGMTVNVIGILEDRESENPRGLEEVERIAKSGGGVSRIVYESMLSQTVQMVTQQAMTQTIQGFVQKELEGILGAGKDLQDIEPEKRGEIIEVVEDLGEKSQLEVIVLVDTSASMRGKLTAVKDALLDLSLSLNARSGQNQFAIHRFPGRTSEVELILDWSNHLRQIERIFPQLTSGGITPTGPALQAALNHFIKAKEAGRQTNECNRKEA